MLKGHFALVMPSRAITGMQKCLDESILTEMGLRQNALDSVALTTTELKSVLNTSVNFQWRIYHQKFTKGFNSVAVRERLIQLLCTLTFQLIFCSLDQNGQ